MIVGPILIISFNYDQTFPGAVHAELVRTISPQRVSYSHFINIKYGFVEGAYKA
jgi:hypothetical protein